MTAIPVMAGIPFVSMSSPFVAHAMPSYLASTPEGMGGYAMHGMMGEQIALDSHVMARMASSLGKSLYYPASVAGEPRQPRVRRTFKELNRELECPHETCSRRYASRSSLATHIRLKHSPEAKQQQEEAKLQRKKSLDKPSTPRPVRPRTLGVASFDMLRRQTVSSFPVVLAPSANMQSLPGTPGGWSPCASPARRQSPSLEHLAGPSSSPFGSYSSDFLRRTSEAMHFSTPSVASTRSGSLASFAGSASQSPDINHEHQCIDSQSAAHSNLAHTLQAVSLDEILLSNFHDLDLHIMDMHAHGVLPPSTIVGSQGRLYEQSCMPQSGSSSDEMEDMRMFLSGESDSSNIYVKSEVQL